MKKVLLSVIVFVFCFQFSFSQQAPGIEWQNTIGGSLDETIASIQQTNNGRYIVGGFSYSNISGDKTENNNGWPNDYWIVKTDASGNLQWQNTIGGNSHDDLFSIQQTIDGGYILGGGSSSNISGDKTENCIGDIDYWIVKTNASGVIQWQNTIGGSASDVLHSIQQTNDGGYIMGGESYSNISGDKSENSNGVWDYWIVKTDASGNIQWQNTIGGNSHEFLSSIEQTVDGGYILGGHSSSVISGDKTENSLGDDYWIVKTDALGNIEWQNTIGGSSTDWLFSIDITSDGGYLLGGSSQSNISGDKTEDSNGVYDYWIVKTDALGNIERQKTIGGSSQDLLYSAQQTADGGYILGGRSESNISGDKAENSNGSEDYWIVKTDALGNIEWQNTIGGNNVDRLNSIQQTSDMGYILGGRSNSNISGDKTENSNGGWDYWIIKLQGCDPCPVPTNLSTTNLNPTFAKLNWQTNWCATGPIGYMIRYKQNGIQTWTNKLVIGNNSFKNISGLLAGSQYQWQVRTKCSSNPDVWSAWSGNSLFTTPLRLGEFEEAITYNIFPNPTTSTFTLTLEGIKPQKVKIEITNTLGQLVSASVIENTGDKISKEISLAAKGIYFITVSAEDFYAVRKVVVE